MALSTWSSRAPNTSMMSYFILLSCVAVSAVQAGPDAMDWQKIETHPTGNVSVCVAKRHLTSLSFLGASKRWGHTMVSWPGKNATSYFDAKNATSFSDALVLIYGGLIARAKPLKMDNYTGVKPWKVYFQRFRMDPLIWNYTVTTSHYQVAFGLRNYTARYAHAAVAMNNILDGKISRAMVVFGGQHLNTTTSTIDLLPDLLVYDAMY